MNHYFVTGTDTDVGKTVACAWLISKLKAKYWKPIQSGWVTGQDDRNTVKVLSGLEESDIFPCTYHLRDPVSPHLAAARENISISLDELVLPKTNNRLVIEGAGGVFVPINDHSLIIDVMVKLNIPIILVARSSLGTINHTLLSLKALRDADLFVAGVILNGPENIDNAQAITNYGNVPIIAHIPFFSPLTPDALSNVPALIEL